MIARILIARILELRKTLPQSVDKPLCVAIHGQLSATTSTRPRSIPATIQDLAQDGRSYRFWTFNAKSVRKPWHPLLHAARASCRRGRRGTAGRRVFPRGGALHPARRTAAVPGRD